MTEELEEYYDAWNDSDMPGQLDALVDLVYVALGTAHMQGFDFNEAWRRVHDANMQKVRAQNADESKRGSALDVVKPEGWKPADLSDLV
jgi:predicted HAD superfamily Cof-like phosphohydrolase